MLSQLNDQAHDRDLVDNFTMETSWFERAELVCCINGDILLKQTFDLQIYFQPIVLISFAFSEE